jgi:hypothetical protein
MVANPDKGVELCALLLLPFVQIFERLIILEGQGEYGCAVV